MKKSFLGTTALAVAGFLAADAVASEPIKLGLGGFYRGAMGGVIGEDNSSGELGDKRRGHAFKQDIEVYFLGRTTLDNGLTVGARIELEGETDGDQIDAAYAYLEGGFGQIRFGDHSEAMTTLCETAPTASSVFSADSPVFNFSNAGTNGTCAGIGDKATKITYFSPDLGGFTFGVSYTPDDAEDNAISNIGTGETNDEGQNSEILSIAANFNQEFGRMNVSVGGGWARAFDREREASGALNSGGGFDGIHDLERWRVHANASVGGFSFGGAYQASYNTSNRVDDIDSQVWSAGVAYDWDAYSIGFSYSHGDYEIIARDANNYYFEDGDYDLDVFSLTGSYALGPGIGLEGMVGYNDYSEDWSGDDEGYDAFEVGLGLSINF